MRLTFTADGNHLLYAERQRLVCCDLTTGEVKPTSLQVVIPFQSMMLARNGRELITWNTDGSAQLWDSAALLAPHPAEPRATLRAYDNNLWLVTTPAGYFYCAPEVKQAIRWQLGGTIYPCAQFEKQYYRPELVRKILVE